MDIIDRIMSLIGGSSGAGIIIATLVGMIKSVWKPKNKKLYWIPASILSVIDCRDILVCGDVAVVAGEHPVDLDILRIHSRLSICCKQRAMGEVQTTDN